MCQRFQDQVRYAVSIKKVGAVIISKNEKEKICAYKMNCIVYIWNSKARLNYILLYKYNTRLYVQ